MTGPTLRDFGERRIVSEILGPRYRSENVTFGDDVADFGLVGGHLVATTDPAPKPLAWRYSDEDYFDWGWLLGALNLSDIAASGALPIGLLTSYTLPYETSVVDFLRLLDGVDAVARSVGTLVRGGNLKEGSAVVDGSALGLVDGRPMSRMGAEPGDLLFAVGNVGSFWAAVLDLRSSSKKLDRSHRYAEMLLRPKPMVAVGRDLRITAVAKSMMDASDGLYATFLGLTSDQGLGFILQADELALEPNAAEVAQRLRIDPVRLALGFGNLELVCSVDPRSEGKLRQIGRRNSAWVTRLGIVTGDPGLLVEVQGQALPLNNFDNERFSQESEFTAGLDSYAQRLMTLPLTLA